jgi:hypothetical protein
VYVKDLIFSCRDRSLTRTSSLSRRRFVSFTSHDGTILHILLSLASFFYIFFKLFFSPRGLYW